MINIVLNQKKIRICKKKHLLLSLWKKTDNKNIKGVALESEIGQQKSTCVDCGSRKSTFLKPVKPIKNKNSFYRLQSMQIYCKNCKNTQEIHFQKN